MSQYIYRNFVLLFLFRTIRIETRLSIDFNEYPLLQVKIWFQNHRYKCKRQAKEKAMAEQNQHNQVSSKSSLAHKNEIHLPVNTQKQFVLKTAYIFDLY